MDINKVSAALVSAYKTVLPELPTQYESVAFAAPNQGMWVRVFNRPGSNDVATLGTGGEDNLTGFFQINIHQPQLKGTKPLNDKASQFINLFKAGSRFTYQGVEVKIRRAVPSGVGSVEGFADDVITVTVYWDARFVR
jgi:hypothetical protein